MTDDGRDGLFDRSCNLLGGTTGAIGYHTTLPAGTPIHHTRERKHALRTEPRTH